MLPCSASPIPTRPASFVCLLAHCVAVSDGSHIDTCSKWQGAFLDGTLAYYSLDSSAATMRAISSGDAHIDLSLLIDVLLGTTRASLDVMFDSILPFRTQNDLY